MTRVVPDDWMPPASMKRIHAHWTAGGHSANANELDHYHILVEGDGTLRRGNRSIADNAPGAKGKPASHTLKGNTGAIGVSLCCMLGAKENPFDAGPAPMTKEQWRRAIEVIADLSERYGILVTPKTILTHAEVQPNLNITQRGKWDIARLSFDDRFKGPKAVGDEMRVQVAMLLSQARGDSPAAKSMPEDMRFPLFRVSGVAPDTLNFRRSPEGDKVGELPERTVVERVGVFGEWWQVRTKLGFVGFVHSSFMTPV